MEEYKIKVNTEDVNVINKEGHDSISKSNGVTTIEGELGDGEDKFSIPDEQGTQLIYAASRGSGSFEVTVNGDNFTSAQGNVEVTAENNHGGFQAHYNVTVTDFIAAYNNTEDGTCDDSTMENNTIASGCIAAGGIDQWKMDGEITKVWFSGTNTDNWIRVEKVQ